MYVASIAVIGMGFVGGAVARAFSELESSGGRLLRVETYDRFVAERTSMGLEELISVCDVIFICVPTPANPDGSCDTSVVREMVGEVSRQCSLANIRRTVVIKSTVVPGTSVDLMTLYHRTLDVVFNPEFLNARSAYEDFIGQDHVVLGGDEDACERVAAIYRLLRSDIVADTMTATAAELVKYGKNCFFATKVSYFNELYQICQALGTDYETVIGAMRRDWRIGWEHTRVPGPTPGAGPWSGQAMMGFGGVCLCKDLQSFMVLACELGIDPKVMSGTWEKNLEVRPQKDWELLAGAKKQGNHGEL